MQSPFSRRSLPRLVVALFAVATGILVSRGDSYAAGTFTASSNVTLNSLNANANADITTVLSIPINDYNFSSVINGTPGASFVAPGPGSYASEAGVYPPLGDVVGTLSSTWTLGFTGNPCVSAVAPSFVFLNATVDNSAGNSIKPVPQPATNPGSGGTLDNMWYDNGASTTGADADPPWNSAWTSDRAVAEGLPASAGLSAAEQANGLPAQVDRYPYYLNTIFDPDGAAGTDPFAGAQPVQPLDRYAGAVNVVGTSVSLNLVIFPPGVLAQAFAATPSHPFALTPALGYTTVVVLNDPTVPAAHGAISDNCSPLGWMMVLDGMAKANPCNGGGGGAACDTPAEISNPTPGANTFARYSHPRYNGSQSWISRHQSLRDFDGDGIENSLDACALLADSYNPRTGLPATEDDDADGLPDACDPNDADGNFDPDGDGWENSYDNCPLDANPTQFDNEQTVAYGTTAPSGGPRGDDIGDPCDPDDTVSNGAFLTSTSTQNFTITGGTSALDSDGDGFTDLVEGTIGTSATSRCDIGFEAGPSEGWPPDLVSGGIFDSTDRVLIDDLNSFFAPIRRMDLILNGFDDPNRRWDLSPSPAIFPADINIGDLNTFLSGVTAFPKMLGSTLASGIRALGGPRCTGIDGR